MSSCHGQCYGIIRPIITAPVRHRLKLFMDERLDSIHDSRVQVVDQELLRRKAIITELRVHLQGAQNRMKRNVDLKRKQFEFQLKD